MSETAIIDWIRGDHLGLDLPAHPDALKAGGCAFLTRAFRAAGALSADNEVTSITRLDEWLVGGTGPKVLLSVTYARDEANLPRDLFVKFSRSFTDKVRDQGKYVMAPEVRLALLTRAPGFPVAAPACLYADYHHETFTGLIICARIPYGQGAVEPHHLKCMDHTLADPRAHYRALISTLARLSGAHRSGRMGDAIDANFPLDMEKLVAGACARFASPQLPARVNRVADFIAQYPHLAPEIADSAFLDAFRAAAPRVIAQHAEIARFLYARPDMIALCHWNAQIDNAWFWRAEDTTLRCGLIDWGGVGQIPVAQSLAGCLSGCEPDFLAAHLDELIALYVEEYAHSGGPALDAGELTYHFELLELLSAVTMTTAPPALLREIPDPNVAVDRYDPIFTINETARVQLKVTIAHLSMWRARDLGRHLPFAS